MRRRYNHAACRTTLLTDKPKPSNPSTASCLSAAAPVFSPAPPPPDVSTVDYFAQTGPSEGDLFGGITPIDESVRVRSEDDLFSDDFTPIAQPVPAERSPQPSSRGRARQAHPRGQARGRGRGAASTRIGANPQAQTESTPPSSHELQPAQEPQPTPPENAPTGPRKDPPPSVRGDRRGTGGVPKAKLTDAELAEKIAAIRIKNATLTAAHARAEADAASFAEREAQAKIVSAQKQKAERSDRQQMMGERERNRMRKLKAVEGREWDVEKNEEDFGKGGRYDKRGGFAGDAGEAYTDGREYLYREPRGGGGRGARGGKNAGAGGRTVEQKAPRQEDFPALPQAGGEQMATGGGGTAGMSWADQVEASDPL